MKWAALALFACVACACPKETATPGGGSTEAPPAPNACEGIRARAEQLYKAEAEAKEPKRVAEATADNTRMVMVDCAKAPARVAPCVAAAASVAELEKKCLLPLDPDGTERSN
jgi:hypothetical protein